MGLWEGIEDARGQKLPFLENGRYVLKVEDLYQGKTQMDDIPFVKAEVTVEEANGEGANPAGSKAVIVIKKDKFGYWLSDSRALIAAILGEGESNVTADVAEALFSDDGRAEAKGTKFHAEKSTGTSKRGATYHKLNFYPFKATTVEEPAKGKGKKAA